MNTTIRELVSQAGGLANATDLAKHWNLSRTRTNVLVRTEGFPEPVGTVGRQKVWLMDEANEWRAERQKGR